MLATIQENNREGNSFGGGDFEAETVLPSAMQDFGLPPAFGSGGGDFGQGFQVVSLEEREFPAETIDSNEGYGGGVLSAKMAEIQQDTFEAGIQSFNTEESDDGSGYGGGGGLDEAMAQEFDTNDNGKGFGGGSID